MNPLAPIIDEMRHLAADELPFPQTCRVKLFDDGTFDAYIFHSMRGDEQQRISYERTTGEIIFEHVRDEGFETTTFADGETLKEPVVEVLEVRVLTTVEPPSR
jgi:hypothetical protein